MQSWIFLILAAVAGILMAVQGSINSALSKIIGALEGNFIVHAVGLIIIVIMLFVFNLGKGELNAVSRAPWYLYLGGAINVAILYLVMISIAKSGAGIATTAIITGQLAMALIIDQFGLFGLDRVAFSWSRGIGLVLMAIAAKLILGK
jgi:transporter family-2 protein